MFTLFISYLIISIAIGVVFHVMCCMDDYIYSWWEIVVFYFVAGVWPLFIVACIIDLFNVRRN